VRCCASTSLRAGSAARRCADSTSTTLRARKRCEEAMTMSYPTFNTITISQDGPLAIVTINREAKLNALSSEVISELTQACAALEVSDEIRVVVVTGAGAKAFVAGADISEMVDLTPTQAQAFSEMGGLL